MNVEIGADAVLFTIKAYINGIAVAVQRQIFRRCQRYRQSYISRDRSDIGGKFANVQITPAVIDDNSC
jgi:hypothetical protein